MNNEEIISNFRRTHNYIPIHNDELALMDLAREDEINKGKQSKEDAMILAWNQGFDKGCLETKEKIKAIINNLGEERDGSNVLVCINYGGSFSTNSVRLLKEELLKELQK